MVRRHRLLEEEAGYVMKAVYLRLGEFIGEEINEESETLFRVLWRFKHHRRGPPAYPEITGDAILSLLYDIVDMLPP